MKTALEVRWQVVQRGPRARLHWKGEESWPWVGLPGFCSLESRSLFRGVAVIVFCSWASVPSPSPHTSPQWPSCIGLGVEDNTQGQLLFLRVVAAQGFQLIG